MRSRTCEMTTTNAAMNRKVCTGKIVLFVDWLTKRLPAVALPYFDSFVQRNNSLGDTAVNATNRPMFPVDPNMTEFLRSSVACSKSPRLRRSEDLQRSSEVTAFS